MNIKKIVTVCASMCLTFFASIAFAGSREVSLASGDPASFVETVFGVWSHNEKVSFSDSGNYSLSLTDFGLGSDFDYLGAMISSPTEKVAEMTYFGQGEQSKTLNFNITKGEYWVSLFAITDSQYNTGTLGFVMAASDVSEVPLPAGAWLFLSALSFSGVIARRVKKRKSV